MGCCMKEAWTSAWAVSVLSIFNVLTACHMNPPAARCWLCGRDGACVGSGAGEVGRARAPRCHSCAQLGNKPPENCCSRPGAPVGRGEKPARTARAGRVLQAGRGPRALLLQGRCRPCRAAPTLPGRTASCRPAPPATAGPSPPCPPCCAPAVQCPPAGAGCPSAGTCRGEMIQ